MSSVKRRKVDGDVPSGLLDKKKEKHAIKKADPVSASTSPEPDAPGEPEEEIEEEGTKTFKDLGIIDSLCDACTALGYKAPTPIQAQSIPLALEGRDLIGLAETGSGKTAAFALPILQALLDKPQPLFGLVLAPTRELAYQISQAFEALGSLISVRCAVIVGGMDMVPQSIALGKKPHIIVATPGRLLDHLENTKGFSLRSLKYLVMDEADRLLDLDFGPILDKILKVLPRERRTYLFSATMSSKVESLQRASLKDPLRVSISSNKYQTVSTLLQSYVFIPHQHKDTYLVYLINEFAGQSAIVFTRTVNETQRIAILLRTLGFGAIPLHGQLSQSARLGALNKFRAGSREILVATDVAARGLDIPSVDVVLNYDLPPDSKTYIHRVGRTARAGKSGHAISVVTQYDVEIWLRIEAALGKKQKEYDTEKEEVMVFKARVEEAQRHARNEMKNLHEDRGKKGSVLKGRRPKGGDKKRGRDEMDREEG
ncbi:DEAD domain containing protein [Hyaloscypha variabilis]